jgi:YidC/Oxa1 family membrane protein insertase
MDKNTILGFVLIGLILVGFSVLNKPNEQEIAQQKRYNDSIALVEEEKLAQQEQLKKQQTVQPVAQQ